MDLFLSFDGRIPRAKWWLGVIALFIALIVANMLVAAIFGTGFFGGLISLVIMLAALYPAFALGAKRLADRGKPPLPRLAFFYGPGLLLSVMQTFGIGFRPMQMRMPDIEGMPAGQFGGMDAMVPGPLGSIVGFLALVAAIWALVELGILKGDDAANQYGPPPA